MPFIKTTIVGDETATSVYEVSAETAKEIIEGANGKYLSRGEYIEVAIIEPSKLDSFQDWIDSDLGEEIPTDENQLFDGVVGGLGKKASSPKK